MKLIKCLAIFLLFVSCKQTEKSSFPEASFSNLELKTYNLTEIQTDFDLVVNSLKEAHTGLYWYDNEKKFDEVVANQRALLKDNLNGLQFYNMVGPIIAFTKEDHCDLLLSDDLNTALLEKGRFMPLIVVNLKQKPIILNQPYKGFELLSINGIEITDVYSKIFGTFAADGFIETSKYRYLDFRGFSQEYAKAIGQETSYEVKVKNAVNGKIQTVKLNATSYRDLKSLMKQVLNENNIREEIKKPAQLEFLANKTAVLTFRTFGNTDFKGHEMNFKKFVDASFTEILKKNTSNLIIDMRDNGGGSEGNEDYLFSYLATKLYNKYKFVELSSFEFSFLDFTDYTSKEDRTELLEELKKENETAPNGKIFRKPGIYIPEPVKPNPFKGNIYVLTSGWTYSGGSEFATLMKEHTDAILIGEETGGGYFGNTSGTVIELTLPNTKLKVNIPILKFVLDVNKGKFGRGVQPDYTVAPTFEEFTSGYDAELEFAIKRILEKGSRGNQSK